MPRAARQPGKALELADSDIRKWPIPTSELANARPGGEPPGPGSAAVAESAGNAAGTGSGRFEKGSGREAGHQLGGGRRQGPGVAGRRQARQPAREPGKALNVFGARS